MIIEKVIAKGKTLLGKPYRCAIAKDVILDCSGYVSHIYKTEGFNIPRSSRELAVFSEKIDLSEVKRGDLLFFKGSNIRKRIVGHVALVIKAEDGEIEMMHSCASGVIIEKYNNNRYYTSRFLSAGRIPSALFRNRPPTFRLNSRDFEIEDSILEELGDNAYYEEFDSR